MGRLLPYVLNKEKDNGYAISRNFWQSFYFSLKNNTDGLWSGANTQYKIENGEIKMLHLSGSLVSHMYEKEGMSYWANVNATLEFVNKKSSSSKYTSGLTGSQLKNGLNDIFFSFFRWH